MEDNEIIKALECCGNSNSDEDYCKDCPYNSIKYCASAISKDALDLINRQKAEIDNLKIELQAMRNAANGYKAEVERLKNQNDILSKNADTAFQDGLNEAQDLYAEQIKNEAKAEAVKEFAENAIERVEKAKLKYQRLCNEQGEEMEEHMRIHFNGIIGIIASLLKETVGDADDFSNRAL